MRIGRRPRLWVVSSPDNRYQSYERAPPEFQVAGAGLTNLTENPDDGRKRGPEFDSYNSLMVKLHVNRT